MYIYFADAEFLFVMQIVHTSSWITQREILNSCTDSRSVLFRSDLLAANRLFPCSNSEFVLITKLKKYILLFFILRKKDKRLLLEKDS